MQGRLVRLEVERANKGDRFGCKVVRSKSLLHQFDELGRSAIALAADTQCKCPGMIDELCWRTCLLVNAGDELNFTVSSARNAGLFKPWNATGEAGALAGKQCSHRVFCVYRIGKRPALRWCIESDTEAKVPGGRDCRDDVQRICDLPGEIVCAPMPAEQRHDS